MSNVDLIIFETSALIPVPPGVRGGGEIIKYCMTYVHWQPKVKYGYGATLCNVLSMYMWRIIWQVDTENKKQNSSYIHVQGNQTYRWLIWILQTMKFEYSVNVYCLNLIETRLAVIHVHVYYSNTLETPEHSGRDCATVIQCTVENR